MQSLLPHTHSPNTYNNPPHFSPHTPSTSDDNPHRHDHLAPTQKTTKLPSPEPTSPNTDTYPKPIQHLDATFVNPILSPDPPATITVAELDAFSATLPDSVRGPLYNKYGKPHKNVSFTGECRFRHIIPFLATMGFLDFQSTENTTKAAPLFRRYRGLIAFDADVEYGRCLCV